MGLKLELLIVASLFAYAYTTSWSCTDSDWFKYKEKYNKTYKSAEVELSHYNTYCDNIIIIDQQNEQYDIGESSYKLAVNQFTDLNSKELSMNRGLAHKKRPIARPSLEEQE